MTKFDIKIDKSKYDIIYKRVLSGERTLNVAIEFGVTRSTINRIVKDYVEEYGLKKPDRATLPCRSRVVGLRFGDLEVLKMYHSGEKRTPWKAVCKCHSCGKEDFMILPRYLRSRKNKTCGCKSWERKKKGANSYYTGYKEITGTLWHRIKKKAKLAKLPFDITLPYVWNLYIKQEKKCALSGLEIAFGESNYDEITASLDRIDSSLGYVMGNVQWVHKYINKMKLNHDQKKFVDLCRKVVEYNDIANKR